MLKKLFTSILLGCASILFAQTGENCQQAIYVNSDNCSAIAEFDNTSINGTKKGSCNVAGSNNSMWFSFIASATILQVDITGTTLTNPLTTILNPGLATCDQVGSFSEIYCGSSTGNTLSFTLNNLTPNQVYYLLVDGNGNNTGSFQICMQASTPPFNDDICNALVLPTDNFCTPYGSYSNIGATADLTVANTNFFPPCFDNNMVHGVWFKFVANTNYINLTVHGATNGLRNPQIALLTPPANDCARTDYWNYTQLACNQNSDENHIAQVTHNGLTIGQTYYLLVDGLGDNMGFFNVCSQEKIISGVENDFCADAIDLCPFQSVSGTTVGATNTNDISSALWGGCNIETNDMVYYRFSTGSPVNDITLDIAYECTGAKLQVAVFEPTAPPCSGANDNWNNIICVEEGFLPQFQIVIPSGSLTANTTYYLVIDDYPSYECSFDLTIRGNAGPQAGFDQQVCSTVNPFNLSGFSPAGGTWSGPGIINAATGRFSPSIAGIGNHTVFYQIGACYDAKNITVSTADIYISSDQEICNGDSTQIFGQAFARPSRIIKTFENRENGDLVDNISNFSRDIPVANIDPNIFNANTALVKVCVNIVHQRTKDLQLYLQAPNGQQVLLSRANGPAGFQYLNTCFVEQATFNITEGSLSSYNGSFQPENSFSALNGIAINGTWTLIIDDLFGGNNGTFYDWSITFFDRNTLNNSITPWSPNIKISNRSISNPLVYPNSTQTYTYVAIDQLNCGSSKSLDIAVVPTEVVSINSNQSEICEGDSAVITVIAPAGKIYDINLTDGSNDYQLPTAQHGDKFIIYPTVTSDFVLNRATLVGVGSNCVLPDDKVIRITVRPLPSFTYDSIIDACPGTVVNMNYNFFPSEALSFIIAKSTGDITVNGFVSNPYQLSVVANQSFEYKVKEISYDNAPFCKSYPNQGTLIRVPVKPTLTVTGDSIYCEGDMATINLGIDQPDAFDITVSVNGNDSIIYGVTNPFQWQFLASEAADLIFKNMYNVNVGCNFNINVPFSFQVVEPLSYELITDTCLANRTGANITFEINGGFSLDYYVNGSPSDSIYSEFVPTSFGYSFTISDDSPCSSIFLNGSVDCSCKSFAGTMSSFPQEYCENDTAFFATPADRVLEHDDTLVFMLHTGSSGVLGDILAVNFDGMARFLPGMVTGSTYTLSTVVGNYISNYPWVDTSDICLSVRGTPITFTPKPTLIISGSDTICRGEEALVFINITGTPPYSLTYRFDNFNTTLTNVNTNTTVSFFPETSGVFDVSNITSENPTCSVDPDTSVSITVIDRPIAENILINCTGDNSGFTVSFDIVGGDPNDYLVTGDPGGFNPNGSRHFVSDTFPSPSNYIFRIENSSTCATFEIKGFNNCNCLSGPGNMGASTITLCDNDTAYAFYDYDYTFDSNDSITFIMHDSSSYNIGKIYAQNSLPVFHYMAGMNYNTTYYISAVVGNYNTSTVVDFEDDCTVAARGTPVIFKESPQVISLSNLTICKGELASLPIEIFGLAPFNISYTSGGISGNWMINDNNGFISITLDTTTTFQLLTLTDNNTPSCRMDLNIPLTIKVVPVPAIAFSVDDSICAGAILTINTQINGNAPFSLELTGPNGFNKSFSNLNNTENLTFTPPSSGIYSFTQITDNGTPSCTNDSIYSFPVTVFNRPEITLQAQDICKGDSVAIQLSMQGTAPFHVTIHDDAPNTTLTDTTTYVIYNSDTTIYRMLSDSAYVYVFYYYDSNPFGCAFEGFLPTQYIHVNANPFISINYQDTICSGNSVNIPITLNGNGPFDVVFSENGTNRFITLNNDNSFITVSPMVKTTYYVSQISDRTTTQCSFVGVDSAIIYVNPSPTGSIKTDSTICALDTLDVAISLIGTPDFNYTITWDNKTLSNASNANGTEKILLKASGWIILKEVTDGAIPACVSSNIDSFYVTINPLPQLTLNAPSNVCDKDPWLVKTLGSGTSPFTLNFTSTHGDFSFENINTNDTLIFFPPSDGEYTLTEIIDGATPTCRTNPNEKLSVTILKLPDLSFESTTPEGCSPWAVDFVATIDPNETNSVNWRFSDGGTSTAIDPPPHTFSAGQHDVIVTAFGKNGCKRVIENIQYVHAYPLPKPSFNSNPNPVGSLNPKVNFYDDVAAGFPIRWVFDSLGIDTTNFPSTFTFPRDKQANYLVCLLAENDFGCIDSICATVSVIGELTIYVPNAFTPNGDGVNDVFIPIVSGERKESYRLSVFNRWGEEVFRTEDLNIGWDGTFAGSDSPSGMYTWQLYAKSEFGADSETHSGLVTLLR